MSPDPSSHGLGFWLSPTGVVASIFGIFGYLPTIVAVFAGLTAGLYYVVQTLQSELVREWMKKRGERRMLRRVARLQYRQSKIIGELKQLGVLTSAETKIEDGKHVERIETTTQPNQGSASQTAAE